MNLHEKVKEIEKVNKTHHTSGFTKIKKENHAQNPHPKTSEKHHSENRSNHEKKQEPKINEEEISNYEDSHFEENENGFDLEKIKARIEKGLVQEKTIPVSGEKYIGTGIPGIDQLFEKGIPKGTTSLIVGGPGSGKTIFCLQTLYQAALAGEKVLYMTLEENPERLKEHMSDFGWNIDELEKKGLFKIQKFTPMDITRQIDAMMEKIRGELMIDLKPLLIPKGFEPNRIALDSLSAVAAALFEKEESYRLYLEQLFTLFAEINATAFLISETPDPVAKLSATGVEEFLADGVMIFYNVRTGNVRESAFEVLKMRGAGFKKKIVAMQIKSKEGILVYPEQEVFTTI